MFLLPDLNAYWRFVSKVEAAYLEFEAGHLSEHRDLFCNPTHEIHKFTSPRALQLDVWVVSIDRITVEDPLRPSKWKIANGHNAIASLLPKGPTDEKSLSEKFITRQWELVILGKDIDRVSKTIYFLIIGQRSKHAARVGTHVVWEHLEKVRGSTNIEQRRVRLM
jgi:hypothetical protein